MQIELARLQARVQRNSLGLEVRALRRALTPAALGREFLSSSPVRSASQGLWLGLSRWSALRRRYPMLLAAATAALPLPGRGRGQLLKRLSVALLAGVWLSRHLAQGRRAARAVPDGEAPDTDAP